MLIGKPPDIPSSAITPRTTTRYLNRRRFSARRCIRRGGRGCGCWARSGWPRFFAAPRALAGTKLETVKSPLTTTGEHLTSYDDITHYNNFYEFGVNKDEPAKNAGVLPTRPWTIQRGRQGEERPRPSTSSSAQAAPAGRPRLSPSLRRGVEHGDSLGGLFALGVHQAVRSAAVGEVCAVPLLLRQAR